MELAVSWLLRQEVVPSVIAGAKTPEQARANAAAGGWHLAQDELAKIDSIVVQAS